ncbi:hypothetical protein [Rhodococcus sp. BS-15]|uniref:hypothetical protein n=1 Tax=Rhodococcus sp. BS-15 TaxID=1304954 RepID=UPI000ADB177A|nr:hypothetical protein [Rhodococcus sp. BS-15]
MDTLGLGTIGISIDVSPSYLDDARALESLGFTSFWLPGGRSIGSAGSPIWFMRPRPPPSFQA